MSLGYITVPRSEYQALLREVHRGAEVCSEIGALRLVLQAVVGRLRQDIKAAFDNSVEFASGKKKPGG